LPHDTRIEKIAGMAEQATNRVTRAWEMTSLLLMYALTFFLWGMHLISRDWFVGIFFAVLIPLVTIKAFLDYRRKGA
jgi:hypothetical protein